MRSFDFSRGDKPRSGHRLNEKASETSNRRGRLRGMDGNKKPHFVLVVAILDARRRSAAFGHRRRFSAFRGP